MEHYLNTRFSPLAEEKRTALRKVSIVIAAKNEEDNIPLLVREINEAGLPRLYDLELVFIDDGSTDRTPNIIQQLREENPYIVLCQMARSYGKTAAWDLGFKTAKGDFIATMDADLQNDPRDIPAMIELLEKTCDLVSGERRRRADSIGRRLQSRIANCVRRVVLKDDARDSGCGLKIFRRECLQRVKLFDGAHRFLEALFTLNDFVVGYVLVNHRERRFGQTKYRLKHRCLAPLADMFGVLWLKRRAFHYKYRSLDSD